MPKRKLRQYADLNTFSNVIQPAYDQIQDGHELRGKWAKEYFNNSHPIVLELGCGKGEYTVNLAEKYPKKNFIGIDRKGARIWTGSKYALENNLSNVAFLRLDIKSLHLLFDGGEIDEIWITFPDPLPKKSQIKKRLTNSKFLKRYMRVLKQGGCIHLKTDNLPFFQYSVEVIVEQNYTILEQTKDLYQTEGLEEVSAVQTFYEKKFLAEGLPITYLKFSLLPKIE